MGHRPWAFWYLEKRLKAVPAGEAGELRMIRTLGCYRDDAEREYVHRRLNAITEQIRKIRNKLPGLRNVA